MRTDFVVREVVTGLRRNVTMTIAMVLTTAISLVMVGTGLLAVRTIDRTEQLYSDRVEVQVALTQDISSADADCSCSRGSRSPTSCARSRCPRRCGSSSPNPPVPRPCARR
jgi:hypothetical protein